MNSEKNNKLTTLKKERVKICNKKMEAVLAQKYEQAAALRNEEKKIIDEIDKIVDSNK